MCGIFGVLRKPSSPLVPGSVADEAMEVVRHRGSGLGGGFARTLARGAQARHTVRAFLDAPGARAGEVAAALTAEGFVLEDSGDITHPPGATMPVWTVMAARVPEATRHAVDRVNARFLDGEVLHARVFQCARHLDVWKDVAHPGDVARGHALDALHGDAWIAHTREPTNSPGRYPIWSHPFAAGETAIVHNGDISSFGANVRFLRRQGYSSFTGTDSEAIAILLNHLIAERGLSPEDAARTLLAPADADLTGAALDGPFAVVATWSTGDETLLLVLLDRAKLRPIILAEDDHAWYVASEEAQVRRVSPHARLWTPEPGRFALFSSTRGVLDAGRDLVRAHRPAAARGQGERFIGIGAGPSERLVVEGPTGNCVANLLDGGTVIVHGNVADDAADTMLDGRLIVHGDARDVLGQALQGGLVLVRGDAGNRVGIQMREFEDHAPVLVVGGRVDAYAGEYMAGGSLVVLHLTQTAEGWALAQGRATGPFVGTGMVGGRIYVRGDVPDDDIGLPPEREDVRTYLDTLVADGVIDGRTRDAALAEREASGLRALLPASAHGVLRLFENKYNGRPRVERRALRDADLARIQVALTAFFDEQDVDETTREAVLSSRWTVVGA